MPHIALEYSANLEDAVDIAALCNVLREAACEIEVFPMPGIRVRAYRSDHYSIADGAPEHGFIDIHVRLREGRPMDKKKAAGEQLFAAARSFLLPVLAERSLALSLEMRDINAELAPKMGTIRQHLGLDQ